MLRNTKAEDLKLAWKVLIMDKITLKIMSHSCKMSEITGEDVSLVENISKRRQPLPTMLAIYFIQPTKENVVMFLSDMAGKNPLYKKAFAYFSSPISRELINYIKKDPTVLPRIGALREMNLEYFPIDSQAFITNNEEAMDDIFGEDGDSTKGDECLTLMATRIATVFASLREFPFVRYRVAKSLELDTMITYRDLVPTKLAANIWNSLTKYKANIANFPQKETCELLILDRSIDQIAPIIHEWTYDAMCHDLLDMEGNKYVHEVPSKTGGAPEKKDVILEDQDPIWLELRHAHIADASERLHGKMTKFATKNKAAQIRQGSRDGEDISTRDLRNIVESLSQYNEQYEKLSLHVDIAAKINKIIRDSELKELGQLEQDLVFGDAGTKEVINFLRTKPDVTSDNKLRLVMIYAAIYGDKLESEKLKKLMELAKLSLEDMNVVHNIRMFDGSSDTKKTSIRSFASKFNLNKKKSNFRKDRPGEEVTWQLSRFYPLVEELVEKIGKGQLSSTDFSCMNDPSPTFHGTSPAAAATLIQPQDAHSVRSRRTGTWARARRSDDGYSSDSTLKHAVTDSLLRRTSSELKKMGQRIFVFIIGGATRSELRACHKLTEKLNREIILGSTSLDDPSEFIKKLKRLNEEEISIDDIEI
ncbi:SNARE-interacting protein KEULE-like [Heracleum sosnowskyi]|uniref:SNARE-interacting protein KEULE-like n=1 Tax=Heracleum sosnowskyi TaxID=360622 RepID=A0AAD8MCF7_9APIA|nr:SNARE-interacting protein KEULE-like [Heracleum sosnowskyi]